MRQCRSCGDEFDNRGRPVVICLPCALAGWGEDDVKAILEVEDLCWCGDPKCTWGEYSDDPFAERWRTLADEPGCDGREDPEEEFPWLPRDSRGNA